MLTFDERAELRRAALGLWSEAKRLADARDSVASGPPRRGVRAGPDAKGPEGPLLQRVDWILDESADDCVAPPAPGVGLVVASRVRVVAAVHDALHEWLPRVWTARDPAVGVGLAIREQPDVAIVDDDLPIMTGLDAAVAMRAYAPRTRVVLLSDDPGVRAAAAREGVLTWDPGVSPAELLRDVVGTIRLDDRPAQTPPADGPAVAGPGQGWMRPAATGGSTG